jgi:hypothetical protein
MSSQVARPEASENPKSGDPRWLETLKPWLPEWAVGDLREMSNAPRGVVVLLAVGFCGGAFLTSKYYNDRMENMRLLVEVAESRVEALKAGLPVPVQPNRPTTWVWAVSGTGVILLFFAGLVIRTRRATREAKDHQRRIDVLQDAARENDRKGDLLVAELDKSLKQFKDRKHDYAMRTLHRYSLLRFKNHAGEDVKPSVTVRFCAYGQDHELAQRTKEVFTREVHWDVTLDGSNAPALQQMKDHKVVFDFGMGLMAYGDLVHAFSEGELLGVTVGQYEFRDRLDSYNLIVEILPSAEAGQTNHEKASGVRKIHGPDRAPARRTSPGATTENGSVP